MSKSRLPAPVTEKIQRIVESAVRTGRSVREFSHSHPEPASFLRNSLAFACFLLFVSLCLLLLVRERTESYRLGYEKVRLEGEREKLRERMDSLRALRTELRSRAHLSQMNEAMGLYLLPPREWMPRQPK